MVVLAGAAGIAMPDRLDHDRRHMPPAHPANPSRKPTATGGLKIRAIGPAELDLLAKVRGRCYDASHGRAKRHLERLQRSETRWGDAAEGDFLIGERNGRAVGTVTALRGIMSVRGVTLPCQGIAWVGTTHDARRTGGHSKRVEAGVATQIMHRALNMARERGEVLTALVPFRATYYEHFGYGLVERRAAWEIPTNLLPQGEADFEMLEPGDEAAERAVAECRRRQVARGHGDMAFPAYDDMGGFRAALIYSREDGYCFMRRGGGGKVTAFVMTEPHGERGSSALHCDYMGFEDQEGCLAILHFLASLRDQYRRVLFSCPVDQPVNLLLRETQVPHRPAEFTHARCDVLTRLQVRILDHVRFFNETSWPDMRARGSATIAVEECEGSTSTFRLDVEEGRSVATRSDGTADFTCADKTWAAIAMGDLKATTAAALGLAACKNASVLALLDSLSHGPPPFCREYF